MKYLLLLTYLLTSALALQMALEEYSERYALGKFFCEECFDEHRSNRALQIHCNSTRQHSNFSDTIQLERQSNREMSSHSYTKLLIDRRNFQRRF